MFDQLEGRNVVREALKENREILEVYLLTSGKEKGLQDIYELVREKGIPCRRVDRHQMDRLSQTGHHQGVIAKIASYVYADLDSMLANPPVGKEPLILLLDGIEDPHNLGSILRSAEVFGATGVVIPKRRAAGITATVAKVASGALEHIPVAQVTNLSEAIKILKKSGYWIAGGEGESRRNVMEQDLTGPLGLVIGNEGKGISRLVREQCDYLVRIPMTGKTGSLNASVAAGILLYEIYRQRVKQKETGAAH